MELNNLVRLDSILKTARKAKGLTREKLAEIINITPRYLMTHQIVNRCRILKLGIAIFLAYK